MNTSAIRRCEKCGASNRVPFRNMADTGRCGSCKAELPPANEPFEADEANFDALTREARVPVLVDFWADWCGPCRMAAPEVAALAREMAGEALIVKVDTEANPRLSARFRIQSIPNFMVLQNGSVVFQQSGLAPRAEMRRWLQQAKAAV